MVDQFKSKLSSYESSITSIKGFIEVMRINYRPLSPEEEQIESQSQELWKLFVSKIQEVIQYVNQQLPSIMEQLNGLYRKYIEELRRIHHTGMSAKYLDPYENSIQIIEGYKKVVLKTLKKKLFYIICCFFSSLLPTF